MRIFFPQVPKEADKLWWDIIYAQNDHQQFSWTDFFFFISQHISWCLGNCSVNANKFTFDIFWPYGTPNLDGYITENLALTLPGSPLFLCDVLAIILCKRFKCTAYCNLCLYCISCSLNMNKNVRTVVTTNVLQWKCRGSIQSESFCPNFDSASLKVSCICINIVALRASKG